MELKDIVSVRRLMNEYGVTGVPFFVMIDFEAENAFICKLSDLPKDIFIDMPHWSNAVGEQIYPKSFRWEISPVPYSVYEGSFKQVAVNINDGNTYLLNLTFATGVSSGLTLKDIFSGAVARNRLLFGDSFVVFSPETFVTVCGDEISSFPMKGTISASEHDAENKILNDPKEMSEHNTIVDLIRNDLSMVADNVSVPRFRYTERISAIQGDIIQVSSEIRGSVFPSLRGRLGDIIFPLLPAGSVSGAPKRETLKIIRESEQGRRGWYTGIFGVFDGTVFDSAVMIRFIEKSGENFYFRSGGGITSQSDPLKEYNELLSKVYLPFPKR
jgi:para-aminobenzoate synthetase component 1